MRRFSMTLCVFALVLAACGGEDGTSDPTAGLEGDDAGTVADAGSTDTQPSDDGAGDEGGSLQGLPPGGTGTVTIDGETIASEWVGNCLIDEMFDPHPDDLDLTASLGGGLEALFLEVSYREWPGPESYTGTQLRAQLQTRDDSGEIASYETIYVTGPDGTWYVGEATVSMALAQGVDHEGVALDATVMTIDGDQITGAVSFADQSGPNEVSFDLTFVEAVDCSL